ncbi:MAG TPA: zf-HC2 domain-containing protein [Thermoanaerobaculia bacterium]
MKSTEPTRQNFSMDHTYIDDHQIAERYVAGRLPPDEREAFENHTMVCAECRERLEIAAGLRVGLQHAAAGAASVGVAAALARLRRSRGMVVAFPFLLLLALVPSGLLLRERFGSETRPTPAELQAATRALDGARQQVARERQEKERLAADLASVLRPQANTPVLALAPTRQAGEAPVRRIALPSGAGGAGWIVLALDLGVAEAPAYRVRLLRADGSLVFQGDGFAPDAQATLTLGLPAKLLAPGDFHVEVDALPQTGKPVPAARFTFRATRLQ